MLYRLSYLGKQEPTHQVGSESGRRDSNSRPSPWQGDVLPLNYARKTLIDYYASIPSTADKRKSIFLLKITNPTTGLRQKPEILSTTFSLFSAVCVPCPSVDPVGFEPTVSSLQRRRLPTRLRAQINCEWRIANQKLSIPHSHFSIQQCRREDSNLHTLSGNRS